MARIVILDADPTGLACRKPGRLVEADNFRAWLFAQLGAPSILVIPEFIDYEVRRSLILSQSQDGLNLLDDLYASGRVRPLPITTPAMRTAARLWAEARRQGQPTAGEGDIDGDVILAAQAIEFCSDADDWGIITENVRHIARYVGPRAWSRREVVAEWLRSSSRI